MTHVIVFEEAQHFQLSKDALGRHQRLEHIGHLLQSDAFTIARIRN